MGYVARRVTEAPREEQLDAAVSRRVSGGGSSLSRMVRAAVIVAARASARAAGVTVPVQARTFWGRSMKVRLPEAVSLELFLGGYTEPGLTKMLLRYLVPGATFFDIGAHFGYYSLLASDLVGSQGRVVAFEPTPATFSVLKQNLKQVTTADAHQLAVHERRGAVRFRDLGASYSAYNSMYEPRLDDRNRGRAKKSEYLVEACSVDEFVADHGLVPDFVKIDAESAEYAIIRGMRTTLSTRRPLVTVEVGDFDVQGATASTEIVDLLRAFEYDVVEYDGRELVGHCARERYAYENLLFVPRGSLACTT